MLALVHACLWLALLIGAGLQLFALALLLHQLRRWTRDHALSHRRVTLMQTTLVQPMECTS